MFIPKRLIDYGLFISCLVIISLISMSCERYDTREVIITYEVNNYINDQFNNFKNLDFEYIFCLDFELNGTDYYIYNYSDIKINHASSNLVNYTITNNCKAHIHNHNDGSCDPSFNDLYDFNKAQQYSNLTVFGIWCGHNNILFYDIECLNKGQSIKVRVN